MGTNGLVAMHTDQPGHVAPGCIISCKHKLNRIPLTEIQLEME
jgi:hypothetical protein